MFCIEAKQMKMNGNSEREGDQGGKGIKLPAMWQSGNLKCNPKKAKANPETKAMFVLLLLLLLIYFIPFQFRAHFMHMILILAKHTRVCVCVCLCVSAICHSSSSFLLPSPTALWLPCCLLLPVCVCVLTHICAVCNLIWLCTCEKAKWNEIGTRQKADSHGDGAHTRLLPYHPQPHLYLLSHPWPPHPFSFSFLCCCLALLCFGFFPFLPPSLSLVCFFDVATARGHIKRWTQWQLSNAGSSWRRRTPLPHAVAVAVAAAANQIINDITKWDCSGQQQRQHRQQQQPLRQPTPSPTAACCM